MEITRTPVAGGEESLAEMALADVVASLVSVESTLARLHAFREGLLAMASRIADELDARDRGLTGLEGALSEAPMGAARLEHDGGAQLSGRVGGPAALGQLGSGQPGLRLARRGLPGVRVQGVRAPELGHRAVAAEIATATRMSDRTVERQMGQAVDLMSRFPGTYRALVDGRISLAHARVIQDAGTVLEDVDSLARYEDVVVGCAERQTPGRVRRIAVREVEKAQAEPLSRRHERAAEERRVWVTPLPDGMAELGAVLPAAVAHGIHDRLSRMARAHAESGAGRVGSAAGEGSAPVGPRTSGTAFRTTDQLRADLLSDLLLRGAPTIHDSPEGVLAAITAHVEVTVPVLNLVAAGTSARAAIQRNGALRAAGHRAGSEVNRTCQVDAPHNGPLQDGFSRSNSPRGGSLPSGSSQRKPPRNSPFEADSSDGGSSQSGSHQKGTIQASYLQNGSPQGIAAELDGCHPIDPETARILVGEASAWNRVLTDPFTGAVLAVDRYRPGEDLRRLLRARDSRCRFPGCGIKARGLDLDHTYDAARGGATSAENLAGLCRRHHMLKHHTAWRLRQLGAGVLEWTSPTGRKHLDRPPAPATTLFPHQQDSDPPGLSTSDLLPGQEDLDPPPF